MDQKKILKDLNFLQISKILGNQILNLSEENNIDILSIIESDTKFLRDHNLMDYSLLFVLETLP